MRWRLSCSAEELGRNFIVASGMSGGKMHQWTYSLQALDIWPEAVRERSLLWIQPCTADSAVKILGTSHYSSLLRHFGRTKGSYYCRFQHVVRCPTFNHRIVASPIDWSVLRACCQILQTNSNE